MPVIELRPGPVCENDVHRVAGPALTGATPWCSDRRVPVRLDRDRVARGEGRFDSPVQVIHRCLCRGSSIQQRSDRTGRQAQWNPVLWALRPGDGGLDRAEVELHRLRISRLMRRIVPQALLFGVRLDEANLPLWTAGQAQV